MEGTDIDQMLHDIIENGKDVRKMIRCLALALIDTRSRMDELKVQLKGIKFWIQVLVGIVGSIVLGSFMWIVAHW